MLKLQLLLLFVALHIVHWSISQDPHGILFCFLNFSSSTNFVSSTAIAFGMLLNNLWWLFYFPIEWLCCVRTWTIVMLNILCLFSMCCFNEPTLLDLKSQSTSFVWPFIFRYFFAKYFFFGREDIFVLTPWVPDMWHMSNIFTTVFVEQPRKNRVCWTVSTEAYAKPMSTQHNTT